MSKKKKLSKKLLSKVQKMVRLAKTNLLAKRGALATRARKQLDLYEHMLGQIKVWMDVTGAPCQKNGADTDTQIADEVVMNFMAFDRNEAKRLTCARNAL